MVKIILGILLAVLAGGAAYLAMLLREGFSTQASPSSIEAKLASAARIQAIPAEARNATNPYAATAERLSNGEKQFADRCAICHATDGSGDTSIGRNLYPQVPDMRLVGTQQLSDGELFYIIKNGVRFTGMPGWAEVVGPEETWNLVLFIRHLPAARGESQTGANPRP